MADSSVKEHVAVKSSKNAQLELNPEPEYIQYRIDLFNKLKAIKDEQLANQPRCPISITLKDGSVREGTAWDTSPLDIAKSISKSLADRTVIAKVHAVVNSRLMASCGICRVHWSPRVNWSYWSLILTRLRRFTGTQAPTFWAKHASGDLAVICVLDHHLRMDSTTRWECLRTSNFLI